MFANMDNKDIILAAATLIGPIASTFIAIYYTRYSDEKKRTNDRRVDIFRNLMKTRGVRLHPDHVHSLNLIQTDFNDSSDVMQKWKEYINYLYKSIPTDTNDNLRYNEEGELLFSNLLVAIGKTVNISLDASEIKHFRYAPDGWLHDENDQRQARKLLIRVLSGLTPITVRASDEQQSSPNVVGLFPPPPNQ